MYWDQWRIQSWSEGGFPIVANVSGRLGSVPVTVSPPDLKKIMVGGGFPGNQKTPLDTPLGTALHVVIQFACLVSCFCHNEHSEQDVQYRSRERGDLERQAVQYSTRIMT